MKKPRSMQKRTTASKKAAPWQASSRDDQQRSAGRRWLVGISLVAASTLLVSVGVLVYAIFSGDLITRSRDQPPLRASATGGSEYFEQAKAQIFKEKRDLGAMRVSEERIAEFFLRNVGGKPLEISQVQSSCTCIFVEVMIGDENSPLFTKDMNDAPVAQDWRGIVESGLTATIRIIYRPSLMPVQGFVARTVRFATNDPGRPVVELSIHATVH